MALRHRRNGTAAPGAHRRGPSTLQFVLIALLLVGLLGGGGTLLYLGQASNVRIDPQTLCPVDAPPAMVQVLLLDASDQLSEAQRLQVTNEMTRLRNALPRFARLEVYALDRVGERLIEPLATLCNPGDGSNFNYLYQNPQQAQRRWLTLFDAPLTALTRQQLAAADASASPIYEAIQAIAIRTFGQPQFDGIPKALLIVSDLLQHPYGGGRHSHYRGVPDIDSLRTSSYFSSVRADLRGVDVSVLYLARLDGTVQGLDHLRFWEQYLDIQGARLVEVKRVFGDR